YEKLSCSNLTFWDLIFYFSKFENNIKDFKYYDWQDVERRMLEFLQTPEKMKEIPSFASIEGIVNGSFRRKNVATLLCLHLACYL
ncbi:AbiH family protein, partial [Enterococcus faecium]